LREGATGLEKTPSADLASPVVEAPGVGRGIEELELRVHTMIKPGG
jgi:hypothetical protein